MSTTFRLHVSREPKVGVAPGTTTITVPSAGVGDPWVAPPPYPYPCPPDPVDWLAADKLHEPGWHREWREQQLTGLGSWFNPYADMISLSDGAEDPRSYRPHVHWNVIGLVGGGAIAIALATSFIASILGRK